MNALSSFVRQNRVLSFVVLAYLFSWWPWPLYVMGLLPFEIASFGPFFAALVILSLSEGKAGVVSWLARMVRWRVGLRWYLVALGLPILLSGLASYFAVLQGAPAPSMEELAGWPSIFTFFPFALLVPGLSGAWEEPGWRGYALHQFEAGRSRLVAMLPLWAIIVVWHAPLFFLGKVEWADVLNMVGGVIVYNWLYHQSGQSVLLVMMIHAMNNSSSGEFFSPMFSGVYSVQQAWMRVILWCAVAAVVLIANWRWWTEPQHGVRKDAAPVVKLA